MTRGQSVAYRLRWLLLAGAALCWAVGAFYLLNIGWPRWKFLPASADPETGAGLFGVMGWWFNQEWSYWLAVAAYFGVFLFTQWLFLSSRGRWRLSEEQTGRSSRRSILVAALMAGLLTVGLLATILHLGNWWAKFAFRGMGDDGYLPRYWPPFLALAIAWAIWACVFFIYWRQGDRYTQLGRILRALIAGSILELLVASPAHALVRHPDECYCVRGSYTGLVLGGTVLLWCFGPGVALLFLREKRRLRQIAGLPTSDLSGQ